MGVVYTLKAGLPGLVQRGQGRVLLLGSMMAMYGKSLPYHLPSELAGGNTLSSLCVLSHTMEAPCGLCSWLMYEQSAHHNNSKARACGTVKTVDACQESICVENLGLIVFCVSAQVRFWAAIGRILLMFCSWFLRLLICSAEGSCTGFGKCTEAGGEADALVKTSD